MNGALSEKQEIFLEILEWILPYLRNVQCQPFWSRSRRSDLYPEAELVHNLPRRAVDPDFKIDDLRWLNVQALGYLKQRSDLRHSLSHRIIVLIERVTLIAPPSLVGQISPDLNAILTRLRSQGVFESDGLAPADLPAESDQNRV